MKEWTTNLVRKMLILISNHLQLPPFSSLSKTLLDELREFDKLGVSLKFYFHSPTVKGCNYWMQQPYNFLLSQGNPSPSFAMIWSKDRSKLIKLHILLWNFWIYPNLTNYSQGTWRGFIVSVHVSIEISGFFLIVTYKR